MKVGDYVASSNWVYEVADIDFKYIKLIRLGDRASTNWSRAVLEERISDGMYNVVLPTFVGWIPVND